MNTVVAGITYRALLGQARILLLLLLPLALIGLAILLRVVGGADQRSAVTADGQVRHRHHAAAARASSRAPG